MPDRPDPLSPRDVFISHAENDFEQVKPIIEALEQAGYSTWYHERDAVAVARHTDQSRIAIEQAQLVLVFVSSSAFDSAWVDPEVTHAKQARRVVAPVLVNLSEDEVRLRKADWRYLFGTRGAADLRQGAQAAAASVVGGLRFENIRPRQAPPAEPPSEARRSPPSAAPEATPSTAPVQIPAVEPRPPAGSARVAPNAYATPGSSPTSSNLGSDRAATVPRDRETELAAIEARLAETLKPVPAVVRDLAERLRAWGEKPAATTEAVAATLVRAVTKRRATAFAELIDHAHDGFARQPGHDKDALALRALLLHALSACDDCYVLAWRAREALAGGERALDVQVRTQVGAEFVVARAEDRAPQLVVRQRGDAEGAPEPLGRLPAMAGRSAIVAPVCAFHIDPTGAETVERIVKGIADQLGIRANTHADRCTAVMAKIRYFGSVAPLSRRLPYYFTFRDADCPNGDADHRWPAIRAALQGALSDLRLFRLTGGEAIADEELLEIQVIAILNRESEPKDANP